ncbi:ABC transporter ATP-binding protein [Adhaeribacter radiodurans]|uniref:ABC transporter ATP-binding protein n=1 Tax=Adhaeribacter radiodurans TaxID=2745197 RepID=A0A7L7L6R0_9BACT|nr:ABC transporter ATP-binding protein [Adhaeribacter radiodurans]QMU28029.1 ABC transporter ATP-binding protein [Adhaeribacter radiodurans]
MNSTLRPKKAPATQTLLQVSGINLLEAGNWVLKDINLSQRRLQKIAIAGETGSGKSTLLQTIAGLVQPSSGEVRFEQKRVKGPQEHLIPGHPGIAYLSQQFELPRFLRVEQVLQYANKLTPEEAETLYEVCRISHLLQRRTEHLSGGERQRIALARLLLSGPQLLLLDEPYSNLDIMHKNILKAVIQDISESLQITCTLISHDPQDTLSWADEIIIMQTGKIIQQGAPKQIYQQPVNAYAAGLFGDFNLLPLVKAKKIAKLPTEIKTQKNVLIRPEDFKISSSDGSSLTGKIKKVNFYGSYYVLEVGLPGLMVKVRTDVRDFKTGDTVSISIAPKALWYV